jgi:hypothetical protein
MLPLFPIWQLRRVLFGARIFLDSKFNLEVLLFVLLSEVILSLSRRISSMVAFTLKIFLICLSLPKNHASLSGNLHMLIPCSAALEFPCPGRLRMSSLSYKDFLMPFQLLTPMTLTFCLSFGVTIDILRVAIININSKVCSPTNQFFGFGIPSVFPKSNSSPGYFSMIGLIPEIC